jgi:hypothetical protein
MVDSVERVSRPEMNQRSSELAGALVQLGGVGDLRGWTSEIIANHNSSASQIHARAKKGSVRNLIR